MVKTLNDYLAMNYRMEIVEDKEEGGFVVSFPELRLYFLRRNGRIRRSECVGCKESVVGSGYGRWN